MTKKGIKVLFIIVFLSIGTLLTYEIYQITRLKTIAHELLFIEKIDDFSSNQNSPVNDVVNIGSQLYKMLREKETPVEQIRISVKLGDKSSYQPWFKQGFSYSIFYKKNERTLRLRMKYDLSFNKFHIRGYSGMIP